MEIAIKNLSYTYDSSAENTLHNISLYIHAGEFVVLTGKSGCGKTTLTRCINGLIPQFFEGELEGGVYIEGNDTKSTPMHELAIKIGSVFQDPRSQFFTTTTTDELAFGCENLSMPAEIITNRVDEAFVSLNATILKDKSIFELSSGERQRIAIASAYAMRPQIFILDEPTANLDPDATKMLGELLFHLKAAGHTVVVSEHKLYYLSDLADRFIYMNDGKIEYVWEKNVALSLPDSLREELGLRAFHVTSAHPASKTSSNSGLAAPQLKVHELSVRRGKTQVLDNITFSVGGTNNDIVGITGKNGVGKTTLARALCGLQKVTSGTVSIDGKKASAKELKKQVYFVMQDADYQLFTESVISEMRFGKEITEELDAVIEKTLKDLGLANFREAHPMTLSGGQKQRLTIACALISDAKILIFDEPTSGLDRDSMVVFARHLESL